MVSFLMRLLLVEVGKVQGYTHYWAVSRHFRVDVGLSLATHLCSLYKPYCQKMLDFVAILLALTNELIELWNNLCLSSTFWNNLSLSGWVVPSRQLLASRLDTAYPWWRPFAGKRGQMPPPSLSWLISPSICPKA